MSSQLKKIVLVFQGNKLDNGDNLGPATANSPCALEMRSRTDSSIVPSAENLVFREIPMMQLGGSKLWWDGLL